MGTGGFVNITQNSKKVVFCGTLKSGKLRTKVGDGQIEITQEGKYIKMVRQVEEITFSSADAIRRNQEVLYVTERAVFRLTKDGVMLTEVAPGIDIEKDILAHMEFKPILAEQIGVMDARIFTDAPMKLDQDWFHKN